MADQAIVDPALAAAPKDYVVKPGVQFALKAVRADMDGSATTSAWLPCLELVSPSGAVMWAAVPELDVAAGGSANVSWFPDADEDIAQGLADFDAAALALQPWAFWKLNEPNGATSAADASGHGRTLDTLNSSGTNSFGAAGLVATSSETSDQITYSPASNVYPLETAPGQVFTPAALTIAAWLATTGGTGHEETITALGRLDTERTWWAFVDTGGSPQLGYIDAGSVGRGSSFSHGVVDGAAHFVAIVLSGITASLYVDGVLAGAQSMGGGLNVPATHTAYVGGLPGGAVGRLFSGRLGRVLVWDKALTAAQIADLYNNGTGGSGGTSGVASVTAGDTSIVVGGTGTDPTLETASLDVIAADHPTAGDWSNNSHKITSVTDPTAAQDAATKAYVDAHAGSSPLTTKGDLYGHSTVDARIPVGSDNQVLVADSAQTLGVKWATAGGGGPGLAKSQLGYTTIGGTTETSTANRVIAKTITPAASGTLIGLAFYAKWQADMVVYVQVAVFDDNAATIGKVLAFASAGSRPSAGGIGQEGALDIHQTVEVARWITVPLTCELAASTAYWIGFQLAPDGSIGGTMPLIFYDGSGTDRRYTPTPFVVIDGQSATQATDSRKYSLYGIYLS